MLIGPIKAKLQANWLISCWHRRRQHCTTGVFLLDLLNWSVLEGFKLTTVQPVAENILLTGRSLQLSVS